MWWWITSNFVLLTCTFSWMCFNFKSSCFELASNLGYLVWKPAFSSLGHLATVLILLIHQLIFIFWPRRISLAILLISFLCVCSSKVIRFFTFLSLPPHLSIIIISQKWLHTGSTMLPIVQITSYFEKQE